MKGIIKAEVKEGKYKGSNFKIHIAPTGWESKVFCNGKDISKSLESVHLHIRAGKPTELILISLGPLEER